MSLQIDFDLFYYSFVLQFESVNKRNQSCISKTRYGNRFIKPRKTVYSTQVFDMLQPTKKQYKKQQEVLHEQIGK